MLRPQDTRHHSSLLKTFSYVCVPPHILVLAGTCVTQGLYVTPQVLIMFYYLAQLGPTVTQLSLVSKGHMSRIWLVWSSSNKQERVIVFILGGKTHMLIFRSE